MDQGRASQNPAPRSSSAPLLPLLCALLMTPASMFLYANKFAQARLFFSAQAEPLPARTLVGALGALFLLGWWTLIRMDHPARRWCAGVWLLIALAVITGMVVDPEAGETAAAWALLLPGWLGLLALLPETFQRGDKPIGSPGACVQAGLVFLAAVVLSFAFNTACILLVYPGFTCSRGEGLFLLARVAGWTGCLCILPVALLVALPLALCGARLGARLFLALLGLTTTLGITLLLLNALVAVTDAARLINVLYTIGVGVPFAAMLCHRVACSGESLAEGLMSRGSRRLPTPSEGAEGNASWRAAALLFHVGLCLGVQLWMGRAHMYYEWGFRTALLYSAISLMATWHLLTCLPRACRLTLGWVMMSCVALGAFTFTQAEDRSALLSSYLKFDKSLGSMVTFYYHLRPRQEPELQRARQMIERSRSFAAMDADRDAHQRLTLRATARRPHVFFIVVDALRRQTYSGSDAHRLRFPGLAWMAPRFVAYDNTWSSYNSTSGSFPALVNGAYNRAWYNALDEVPHSNVLVRAATLAGHRCYNLATEDADSRDAWPDCTAIPLPKGGQGKEDPAVVFKAALALVDERVQGAKDPPAFIYMHLYNMHQPLLRRSDAPFDGAGKPWLKALYEHNAAYLDAHLHRFLLGLSDRDILDDALVVITADHGEEMFDLGGLYHGWQINPLVMQVPLFIHYPAGTPGAPPPGVGSERAVNLIDVAPTICDVMGAPIARASMRQGVSLLAPEPEGRSFPLLSWQRPLVGRVGFAPPLMVVLDTESGAADTFSLTGEGFRVETTPVSPTLLTEQLSADIGALFEPDEPMEQAVWTGIAR